MTQNTPKPDRREYTLMIVPHHGKSVFSIRIPIKTVKYAAVTLGICLTIISGTMLSYRNQATIATKDKFELNQLREVNYTQQGQLEELAKTTSELQQNMNRLNQLDSDLRRMVNSEDTADTSRSAPPRLTNNNGQGGPTVQPKAAELLNLVKDLKAATSEREESLLNLKQALADKKTRMAATPSIWPAGGEVTSRFGWRNSPWGGGGDWHPGIDIANDSGTPIYATADGVVASSSWFGGYGNMVELEHGNGITSIYGHNSQNLVSPGQQVKKGQLIAYMGSTGYSTGPHVHYEIRVNGTAVNPASFL